MDAFTLAAKLTLDSGDFERDLGKQEGVFKQFGNKLGSAFSTVGKVGAAAIGAAATAVGALTKTAVESYAEYEQLVGGVETLFGIGGKSLQQFAKESGKTAAHAVMDYRKVTQGQRTVLQNAQKAYKTAGLSMNQYMETVTSFSASLIQSLQGDQAKAAKVADQAIIDMSDNANKMGTSMEAIQNAYQGFAKQNYTMLDNLKLGYGGTKTEMERLIADANNLKKANGEMADLSIERFSDVVEAIHLIQTEMGITGTTAEEAEKTISGSIGMMKASWQNLLTALGDGNADIGPYIDNLVSSAETAFDNILPVVEKALTGIASFVEKIAPKIQEKLPGMVEDVVPKLLNAAGSILQGVIDALPNLFKTLSEAVGKIDWKGLGTSIWDTIKGAFEGIAEWFSGKFTAAKTAIGEIKWDEVGTTILTAIGTGFAAIQEWIIGLFSPAVTALTGEELNWENAGSLIIEAITTGIGNVVDWATKLFTDASTAISEIDWVKVGSDLRLKIETAVVGIINWFTSTFNNIISGIQGLSWSALGEAIVGLIKEGLAALDGLFSGLLGENWENFKKAFEDLKPVLQNVAAAAVGVAVGFATIKAAITITTLLKNVEKGFGILFDTITKHPFAIIVGAILGLVAALVTAYLTNEDFRNKVDAAWKAIKETAQTVWATISGAVELAFEVIQKAWEAVSSFFTETIPNAWKELQNTASTVFGVIKGAIDGAINVVKTAWEAVVGFFTTTIPEAWKQLNADADTYFGPIKSVIEGAINIISTAWAGVENFFTTTIPNAWKSLKGKADEFLAPIKSVIKGVTDAVKGFVDWWKQLLGLNSSKDFTVTTTYETIGTPPSELLGEQSAMRKNSQKGQQHTGGIGGIQDVLTGRNAIANARSMYDGTILRGATMFGWDAHGRPQIGGGEGPEAVVGVNSLNEQIRGAVRDGLSGIVGAIAQAIGGRNEQPVYVVLDTGELVGAIGGKMDAELGKIGDWKGGGRA